MPGRLGRGGVAGLENAGRIWFENHTVRKYAPAWEPWYMQLHGDVFVRVLATESMPDVDYVTYMMPRIREAAFSNFKNAMLSGLERLTQLWGRRLFEQPDWRNKLRDHLNKSHIQYLPHVEYETLDKLVLSLPNASVTPCAIHGDPTFANLLYDRQRRAHVWCDPLKRDYIPNDPHVDLGKMFQSCWGYERVILDEDTSLELNEPLARELAERAHLDYDAAQAWCLVHFIRLLRYQEPKHREIFQEFVSDQLRLRS